jgi:hypothetical protein
MGQQYRLGSIVSPFDESLSHLGRGDQYTAPEPMGVWSTIAEACQPFRRTALLVTSAPQVPPALLDRARTLSGFKEIRTLGLKSNRFVAAATSTQPPNPSGSLTAVTPYSSPLMTVPKHHFDAIVLEANALSSFGPEWLADAITDCYQTLHPPSGIFCVFGSHPVMRLNVSPKLKQDYADYQSFLESWWKNFIHNETTAKTCDPRAVDPLEGVKRKRRRLTAFRLECSRSGFSNVYFPFRSLQRKWYESKFELTVEEILGFLRSDPRYRALHEAQDCQVEAQGQLLEDGSASPFRFDVSPLSAQQSPKDQSTPDSSDNNEKDQPKGITGGAFLKRTRYADPLDSLVQCLRTEVVQVAQQRGEKPTPSNLAKVRLSCSVSNFVLTADDRPVGEPIRMINPKPTHSFLGKSKGKREDPVLESNA